MTLQPVDDVQFLVLVDNSLDSLSSGPGYVTLEWPRLMRSGMSELSGEAQCCANHGLSLLVTARVAETAHTLMFDAGPENYVLERNAPRLGVDFSMVEGIVLSHGHWDHAGGLPAAVRSTVAATQGRDVTVYVHPDMFRQRAMTLPSGAILPIKAIPTPDELRALGAKVRSTDQPQVVLDDFFWMSGEIPRRTPYEKGFPGHLRRSVDRQAWEPDPMIMDERCLVVHLRNKGLVVFTACSHAGVVNVLLHAQESFPSIPVYAVAGGFHLSGANEKIIPQTVQDLASFDLSVIAPGHCTGWRATQALVDKFGDQIVVPSAVGKTYTL
ncbi:MAG TPA: MBL fold metallo-hydrolase [Burkholderiales bacterium]|nr:MBL fold metallo-hydrolase [Burkholderiales bacterium]